MACMNIALRLSDSLQLAVCCGGDFNFDLDSLDILTLPKGVKLHIVDRSREFDEYVDWIFSVSHVNSGLNIIDVTASELFSENLDINFNILSEEDANEARKELDTGNCCDALDHDALLCNIFWDL